MRVKASDAYLLDISHTNTEMMTEEHDYVDSRGLVLSNLLVSCVAMTTYHRLDALNNRHRFLRVLKTRNSKIKVPVNSVCGEDFFPRCR